MKKNSIEEFENLKKAEKLHGELNKVLIQYIVTFRIYFRNEEKELKLGSLSKLEEVRDYI